MYKFLFSILFAVLPISAFAHATPVEYEPPASSANPTPPHVVTIRFSERAENSASSIKVLDPKGQNTDLPGGEVSPNDPRVFIQPFQATTEGAYTVSWQVVSADDGHFTKGAYVFFVGSSTIPIGGSTDQTPSFSIVHSSGYSEAIAIAAKLFGEDMILGLFALLFLFGYRRAWSEELKDGVIRRAQCFFIAGAAILCAGTLAYIELKTTALSTVQEISLGKAFSEFTRTTAGICSLILLVLLPCLLFLARPLVSSTAKGEKLPLRAYIAGIFFLIMSYTQARLSHAAASDILPTFSIFVNLIHLFGKGLWVGSLAALLFVFLPALDSVKASHETYRKMYSLLGKAIATALLLGGVSGVWIVWIHLKDPANIMTSDWGHIFLLLSFFAAILFVLRMVSFFFLEKKERCAACMRSYALLEAGIGVAVIFYSALIIITTPPLLHGTPWQIVSNTRDNTMTLEDDGSRSSELLLTVIDNKGTFIDGNPIVTATNEALGIGPIVMNVTPRFPGGFGIDTRLLSPPGTWKLAVAIERKNAYNANGKFTLDYPNALASHREEETKRHWGKFEQELALLLICIILLACVLFFIAQKKAASEERTNEVTIVPTGNMKLDIVLTLFTLAFFVGTAYLADKSFFVSTFQKLCLKEGGMWHQSVPMKDGKVLSPLAKSGCMTGSGSTMSHYVDEREFREAVGLAAEKGTSLAMPMGNMDMEHMEGM